MTLRTNLNFKEVFLESRQLCLALVTETSYIVPLVYVGRLDGAKFLGAATLGNML